MNKSRKKAYRKAKRYLNKRSRKPDTWGKVASIARTGLKVAKWVASVINVEYKFIDFAQSVTPSTSGSISWLTQIPTGTDSSSRSGQSVLAKSMFFRFFATKNASSSATNIRCVIVIDTQNNGTAPAVSDVIQTTNQLAPLNQQQPGRFTILYDKLFVITSSGPSAFTFKVFKRLQHHIKWDQAGDTATDARSGHVYIVFLSNETVNTPTVSYYSRIRYTDN